MIGHVGTGGEQVITKAQALGREVRRGMVEPRHPTLSISRSSFYYTPKGESAMNLASIRQIDEQFLEPPQASIATT